MRKVFVIALTVILILAACSINPVDSGPPPNEEVYRTPKPIAGAPTEDPSEVLIIATYDYSTVHSALKSTRGYDILKAYKTKLYTYDYYAMNDYLEFLKLSFMAGENNFDMFIYKPDYIDTSSIIENHFFYDLSNQEEIMEQFDLMYDAIKEKCIFDDEVFGFPDSIRAEYMTYDTDRLSDLEIDVEDVNTFEDLFELDDRFNETEAEGKSLFIHEYLADYYLIYNIINSNYDYTTHFIDFTDVDIAKAKAVYNELHVSGIARASDKGDYRQWIGCNASSFDGTKSSNYISKPLYIDGDEKKSNPVTMSFISINPYSDKIDLASQFIVDYAKYMKTKNSAGSTGRYSDYIYKDLDTYLNRELDLKPASGVSEEELRRFDKIYENSNLVQKVAGYDECAEILLSYYNDEISEQTAKDEMQKIMDIVFREYTLD